MEFRGPDISRPRIELHPEDHIYREPITQYLNWNISSSFRRPDGVLKRVFTINDLFPGPTIEARAGDTLIIAVNNTIKDESFSIHWHGLHVHQSMDGAVGVTQNPIEPGTTFVYNLTIPPDQSGTFWYHAHSGVARADGLYGGFVIHRPSPKSTVRGLLGQETSVDSDRFHYNKELLLLIGDWYHRSAPDVLSWYMRAGSFGNEPVPDSLVINGAGHFDCSMAVPARPLDCLVSSIDPPLFNMERNLAYRIRVVNTGSLAGFSLAFSHQNLELIQLDSVDVEPQQKSATSLGNLFPGQRMDFVIRTLEEADDGQGPMYMTVELDRGCFRYPNPALTPEQTFEISTMDSIQSQKENIRPKHHLDIEQVPSARSVLADLPPTAQQTHVVYTKIEKLSIRHNIPYGFFNRTSWKPQSNPPQPLNSLSKGQWDENQFSLSTGPEPVWVDLVVNNLDEGDHPFHLHGHHFYVLAIYRSSTGWGSYNPFSDARPPGLSLPEESDAQSPYDLSRAILRDTVQIPRRGYAVLRFRADNPGVWLFHCHILWHLASGMAMIVEVG
ncbi:hypothetical protein ASPZODRAFT_68692 [Penicilliopsis zonata CBS 506.65]|uniref:Laccase n=1 Tax=Penicilliopsis zonata CBS 506.65 TaxID=1073090 RepID=A0A1L9SEW7_9EURO|nr:hypothetical protein ASPZODRAFT_68692 [Penicilliopsis zonata CBS 506.65]OJJ45719.1 hypothetical protein ASPZODRAFT_68692 [Penicilliopsis zonata CBS 506.65]